MTARTSQRRSFTLVIVAMIAALIVRAVLRQSLERRGINSQIAADLSYLAVPALLLLLTIPIWSDSRAYIGTLFRRSDLSIQLVLSAIGVAILLRIAWWGMTIARVSFGWFTNPAPGETVGPSFAWHCPAFPVLLLGIFVMAILVPTIEEIFHRGYVFRAARAWSLPAALVISSVFFTVFHSTAGWGTVFVIGLILALQFHLTDSLWSSTITHATYNFLIQFDWRCLRGQWRVAEHDLPLTATGLVSLLIIAAALTGIFFLLRQAPGTTRCPGR